MDGTKMVIGGREFVVPPARMRASKAVLLLLMKIPETVTTNAEAVAFYDIAAQACVAGLKRNYPDLTADEMEDYLPGTIAEVNAVLLELGQLMGTPKSEEAGEGEAQGR